MTAVDEAVREGSSPPAPEGPEPTAKSRACARKSVTPAASGVKTAVTHSGRRVGQVAAGAAALLDKPGTLAHAQPMTFAQARARHHQCAGHYSTPVVRWARLAWGYTHLAFVKTILNLAEWVTETPSRFIVAVLVIGAVWIWG